MYNEIIEKIENKITELREFANSQPYDVRINAELVIIGCLEALDIIKEYGREDV